MFPKKSVFLLYVLNTYKMEDILMKKDKGFYYRQNTIAFLEKSKMGFVFNDNLKKYSSKYRVS